MLYILNICSVKHQVYISKTGKVLKKEIELFYNFVTGYLICWSRYKWNKINKLFMEKRQNICSNLWPFIIGLFVLLSLNLKVYYIFWIKVLYQMCDLEIFSLSLWLPFLLLKMSFKKENFLTDEVQSIIFFLLWVFFWYCYLGKILYSNIWRFIVLSFVGSDLWPILSDPFFSFLVPDMGWS